jgi:hypothetical protein
MNTRIAAVLLFLGSLTGCSKHDCKLESEAEKAAFEDIAPMTKGAFSCFPHTNDGMGLGEPSLELAATWGDSSIDAVTEKYKTYLDAQGWTTKVEPHSGKPAGLTPGRLNAV